VAEKEYDVMPELPCSRGEVDGLQSRKKICIAELAWADWPNEQMTCSKCKQHFCYRCGSKLPVANPYVHYSRQGEGCYAKLFDVTEMGWDGPMEAFVWV
jgi:hypothetical protein